MQILSVLPTCSRASNSLFTKANEREIGETRNRPVAPKQKGVDFLKRLAPPAIAALVTLSPIFFTPGDNHNHRLPLQLDDDFWDIGAVHSITYTYPMTPLPLLSAAGQTADIQRGATLFGRACIGCHDAGGNIIQPGATLFTEDLQRNGIDTEEEIYRITYFGKGRMPGFGENCTPRGQCTFGPRLQDEEIKLLAEFVKSQADQGWPNIASDQD